MKKNTQYIVAGILAAALALAPAVGIAQDKPQAPAAGTTPDKPAQGTVRPVPFRGTVAAVDKTAKTVTVGERAFHVSSETRLFKGNRPATLDDMNVGDVISGNYLKGEDGKLTAKMIRFSPKSDPVERPTKKEKPADNKNATAE